ncbi:LysM peptidoglycan-binding domain-containing protein [Candidatus Saccharibacteria bacterium]|nr:MAG: LysM peptidoglycan-binding domain-containing protein [Candidatus Saccharibacteria bacterium]
MRKRLQTLGPLLVVSILLFTHASVFAQAGSMGIAPANPLVGNLRSRSIFIHTLKGGETVEDGVRVFNYSKEARTVKLDAVDSIAAVDGSFSCKQNSEKKTEVGLWIRLSVKEVVVQPGANETVPFTITVPKEAGPGEHGACITAQDTKNIGSKSEGGIALGFRNAIRVAITVPGKIVKQLNIKNIAIGRNDKGNYTVSPVSKNTGNVSLDATSRAQLKSIFGQQTPVQKATYPVMPGATTGWAFEFKRPFWGGVYKAQVSIAYDSDTNTYIGDTTGQERKVRASTGYFIMVPTWQALVVEIAVPLALVFILITFLRRRRLRRLAHKRLQKYTVAPGDTVMSIAEVHGIDWKQLAKVNIIKAPYLIEYGQTLLLPQPKKRLRHRRAERKGSWVVDDASPKTPTEQPAPLPGVPQPPAVAPVAPENTWQAPIAQTQPLAPVPQRYPVPPHIPNPAFPEPEEPDFPDWRDGASDEELRTLGVLKDSATMPALSSSWNLEADEPTSPKPKNSTRPKVVKRKHHAKLRLSAQHARSDCRKF